MQHKQTNSTTHHNNFHIVKRAHVNCKLVVQKIGLQFPAEEGTKEKPTLDCIFDQSLSSKTTLSSGFKFLHWYLIASENLISKKMCRPTVVVVSSLVARQRGETYLIFVTGTTS